MTKINNAEVQEKVKKNAKKTKNINPPCVTISLFLYSPDILLLKNFTAFPNQYMLSEFFLLLL